MFSKVISTLLLAAPLLAAPIRRAVDPNDILVFQFAGVLEALETEFYTQALGKFKSSDFISAGFNDVNIPIEIFSGIMNDESTHLSVIQTALQSFGVEPISGCQFNFGNALDSVATMAATARVVENVGVSAYLGGANLLVDKELLVAAATILTVEARHQSLLNVLNVATSIPSSFDISLSPSQVLSIAGGFISGCDLGIPATPSLTLTNTGTVAPGTALTFSSAALNSSVDTSKLTCQMMTGGAAFALSLPFNECIVPAINGPVYIYVVNGDQPLLNSQSDQFSASIIAGPLLAFIDSIPEDLGQVAKGASGSLVTSTTISMAQATALVAVANAAQSPDIQSVSVSVTASEINGTPTDTSASTATGGTSNGAVSVLGLSMSNGSQPST